MVTVFAVVPVVSLNAAEVPATTTNFVSLDELVNEVLANNPESNFYQAEIAAAKGGRKTAGAWANPELNAEVGQKRAKDSAGALLGEGAAWSVSVNQTFEFPGRLSLRKSIANRDIELAELGFAQFKSTLAARVRMLGYDIFIAQEEQTAAREVADRFQALTDVLVQRDPAGITPVLETRIIEANAITLQRHAGDSAIKARTALMELNQLRGQPADLTVHINGAQFSFQALPAVENMLDLARTNAFELRIRQSELERQGFQVALAKNERFPGVTVGPFISEERAGDRERTIGLGISLPLPLWNRNAGNIETAKARESQAQTSWLLARRDVERRITENALVLDLKLKDMDRWRTDSSQPFREAAELADRHYRLGAVPISTYVELQKQYLEATEAILETKREALAAAQTLELLTGMNLIATPTITKPTHE